MIAIGDWWWRMRDERRRTRKRLPQMLGTDVLFVSHAKSGRTWLRVLISQVWHLTRGVPADQLLHQGNFKQLDAAIPDVFFTSDYNEPGPIRRRLPRIAQDKRLALMMRDPRDIAVSYFFQQTKRSNERVRARLGIPRQLKDLDLEQFVLSERYGLASVIDFMNRWQAHANEHPRALILRYEDVCARPAKELGRTMRFLGDPAPAEAIEAAVEFGSFARLKEKERSQFFDSERMRPTNASDPDSFKVRRGKIGGYRDYFSPHTIARMDAMVRERLSPVYGY